jgi:hypothetical protein
MTEIRGDKNRKPLWLNKNTKESDKNKIQKHQDQIPTLFSVS